MSITSYIEKEISMHPSFSSQDLFKLVYQASFGREHIMGEKAYAYLEEEYNSVSEKDIALYEAISDDYIRVNLASWKYNKLSLQWLKNLFFLDDISKKDENKLFYEYLEEVDESVHNQALDIDINEYDEYKSAYLTKGLHPVHHSDSYREKEEPHYRLIPRCFERVIKILLSMNSCGKRRKIIAIDGRAASGKTTIAEVLSKVLDAPVVHMDDFFLPLEKRTAERLSEPGGNIDYERFIEEVSSKINDKKALSYGVFDCSEMRIKENREISLDGYLIIEGSYSHHPKFGEYADYYVFSDVNEESQLDRILRRNGEKMLEIFKSRWIPMEERYFEAFSIKDNADLIL